MSSIRLTVSFDQAMPLNAHAPALARLAADLHSSLEQGQRLTRMSALTLPGAAVQADPINRVNDATTDRIFKLEAPDGDRANGFLRALGGWLMHNRGVGVVIRVDGPGGGVNLRLTTWSAVAFAAAVTQVQQRLTDE